MRRLVLSFVFLVTVYSALSQRLYFVYLQTESRQPFFVKINEKLYSSTASGYLILPRLKDSTYNFTVGLGGNQPTEQKFNCIINKKDHGYLVKDFGDKGWGLLDLQTLAVQMSSSNEAKKDVSGSGAPVNNFTELLSKAADDSTLKQKIVFPEETKTQAVAKMVEKKTDSALTASTINTVSTKIVDTPKVVDDTLKKQAIAAIDSQKTATANIKAPESVKPTVDSVSKQNTTIKKEAETKPDEPLKKEDKTIVDVTANTAKVKEDVVQEPAIPGTESFNRTKVIRKSESSTTEGFGVTYIDVQANGIQDTIKIIIPAERNEKLSPVVKTNDTVLKKEEAVSAGNNTVSTTKDVVKNNCRLLASDEDFYKLRKKMAVGKSDNAMLAEANKIFKSRCFTTGQLKNLSALFLGDGGKYNFFDAAYSHVFDVNNFSSLQSELKDEYFVNRFKAMLR